MLSATRLLRAFARRHPISCYYVLVFVISWGGILVLVAPTGIPGRPEDVDRLFMYALAALFAGPSISGLVMTAVVGGRAGFRNLLDRLLRWRVGTKWWAVALLTGPAVVAAVLFSLALFLPAFTPGLITTQDRAGLLIIGLGAGMIGGGLLEELGWTGFAVPTLRQRIGVFATGLVVGVLWGVWHLLIAFWASRGLAGDASLSSFIAGFVAFYLIALPAFRVLLVWIHDQTASLMLVMCMHAMLSASTVILQPLAAHGHLTWNLLVGVALWGIVWIVATSERGKLSRPPVPPATAPA